MSIVNVTVIQPGRYDSYGRPLIVGNVYPMNFDDARALWQAGYVSVPNSLIFSDSNYPCGTEIVTCIKPIEFRACLLPSLVVSSVASRTLGVVTITATSHGITTGATYVGFRYFYPGSASLAAGWYDSILSIPDANTLTFYAPGPDFLSESVNGASAYVTNTDFCSVMIPAGSLDPYSSITATGMVGGDTTAGLKNFRVRIGASVFLARQFGVGPSAEAPVGIKIGDTLQSQYVASYEGNGVAAMTKITNDFSVDQPIGFVGNLGSAGCFMVLYNFIVTIRK